MQNDNVISLEESRTKKIIPKTKKKNLFSRHGILIVGILMIGYFFYALGLPMIKTHNLEKEIATVEAEMRIIEKKNKELRQQIEFQKTDTYVERVAREKLGYVKPGEVLIVPGKNAETK